MCPNRIQRTLRVLQAFNRTAESCGFVSLVSVRQSPLYPIWTSGPPQGPFRAPRAAASRCTPRPNRSQTPNVSLTGGGSVRRPHPALCGRGHSTRPGAVRTGWGPSTPPGTGIRSPDARDAPGRKEKSPDVQDVPGRWPGSGSQVRPAPGQPPPSLGSGVGCDNPRYGCARAHSRARAARTPVGPGAKGTTSRPPAGLGC